MSAWSVGVCVPARNEERRIERCLHSVLEAAEVSGAARTLVVVSVDRSTDRTAVLARNILGEQGRVIECDAGSPGTARRLGTDRLLAELCTTPPDSLWLANTDADTIVPPDWIRRQLNLAQAGAMAVAGIVCVDSFARHGPHGAETFARNYMVNADGTHSHVHGANLGVRADIYAHSGGWSDMQVGEDHSLWRRVKALGAPVCATTASVVKTSGRLRGRARGGFADTLARHLREHLGHTTLPAQPLSERTPP